MYKPLVFCVLLLMGTAPVQADILLGDLVGGGDGSGNAPAANIGVNPDTGVFATAHIHASIPNTGAALVNVAAANPGYAGYVDSVFIITAATNPITSTGVTFGFTDADDIGTSYNVILKDRSADAEALGVVVAGKTYATGVGIHSSVGVTFDLAALRALHGNGAVKYASAVAGGDACSSLDVVLHMVQSSDSAVLDAVSYRATAGRAVFFQRQILDGARFLTLATASNGADACDHGNFAEARITAAPVDTTPTRIYFATPPALLAGSSPYTLDLLAELTAYSALVNLENADPQPVYTVSNPAVLAVEGRVLRGVSFGAASLTVDYAGLQLSYDITVGIDLGGIAAGSDGFNAPPAGNIGINQDTGAFVTAQLNGAVTNTGSNPQAVGTPEDLIDSVFLLLTDTQVINTGGFAYAFSTGDANNGSWDYILNGREPGGPAYLDFGTRGRFTSGIGIHGTAGITYDVENLRTAYGADKVKRFLTIAGEAAGSAGGSVNAYVIASSDGAALGTWRVNNASGSGNFLTGEIPEGTKYLTFAIGDANNGIGSDHGAFGLAVVTGDLSLNLTSIAVTPTFATLRAGDKVQCVVTGTLELGGLVMDVTDKSTFASSDPAVATVDAAGLITAVGSGACEITVNSSGLEKKIPVYVTNFIDLGEIVGGGDGTAAKPPAHLGINADTGAFGDAHLGNVLITGNNPQAVDTSSLGYDFIDSTFIISDEVETLPINTAGDRYDFALNDSWANTYDIIISAGEPDMTARNLIRMGPAGVVIRGIGIHAAAGITYDLAALRAYHGAANVKFFSAYGGEGSIQASGSVTVFVIMTDGTGTTLDTTVNGPFTDNAQFIEKEIPARARFLTLAVGAANNSIASDHGVFGNAFLTACSIIDPGNCGTNAPPTVSVAPAGPVELDLCAGSAQLALTATADDPDLDPLTFSWTVSGGGEITAGDPPTTATATFAAEGAYTVRCTVSDGTASASADVSVTVVACPGVKIYVGDANCSSVVDIADAICTLGHLFGAAGTACKSPCCKAQMDTNDDNTVNIADAITVLSYLFNKQPMKGPDGTPLTAADAGCRVYPTSDVVLPCAVPNCAP